MFTLEFFSPPDGETIMNPRLDRLKDLILNKGETYWNAGAGQGSLTREEDGRRSVLALTMARTLGFYLQFTIDDEVSYDPIGEGNFDKSVTVYVGGDPWVLPTAFLVPKEHAWVAVEEFCKTGQRSNKINWKNHSEVNWHYGFPEET